MRKLLAGGAGLLLALAFGYLAAWPVAIDPVAWTPPKAPALAGPYAPNRALASVEWLGRGTIQGPEATAVDATGRVFTGLADGRIVRLAVDGRAFETVANTGGRPLGMAIDRSGDLVVCDTDKGLLRVTPAGSIATLATEADGGPFRFTDDVDVADDGMIYFTDASSKWGRHHYREDVLEHGGHGRLMALRPGAARPEVLRANLAFANGVALNSDGSWLAVAETGAYRIHRFWLAGPKKGTFEPFVENLPGFPDNVTFSRTRRVFWVALFAPRNAALDSTAPHRSLTLAVARLPSWAQPKPARHAFVLGFDEAGQVVHNLQDASPGAFAPVTSAREHGGKLYLGSLTREALGRIDAP